MLGRACGTYRWEDKCVRGFRQETLKEKDHLEDLEVDVRVILKCTLKVGHKDEDLILLAYDRVHGGLLWPWIP
jgi:hypothetical protein